MAWKPCGLLPRRCVSCSAAPGCLNTLRWLPAGKQGFADSSPAMRIKVKVEAGAVAGSRAWQMAPSRPCSLAWSQPCGAQAVCGRARLEAELGASGGGGAGGVSPTEGWSFRSWVPADGREGLQSCSRGAASSAHRPPSVPGLSALGRAGEGPPAAPPGDVTGAGVRDLRRAPRRSGCSALSFCVTWSPTRVCRDVLPLL